MGGRGCSLIEKWLRTTVRPLEGDITLQSRITESTLLAGRSTCSLFTLDVRKGHRTSRAEKPRRFVVALAHNLVAEIFLSSKAIRVAIAVVDVLTDYARQECRTPQTCKLK